MIKHIGYILFALFAVTGTAQIDNDINKMRMNRATQKYGIEGHVAPELNVPIWIDANGTETEPIQLHEFEGKVKVIYCFQAWCPGCHSRGLPSLQKMVTALADNDQVEFLAIQTVFEGAHANTFEKVGEIQQQYELKIPFGHDVGTVDTGNISSVMHDYGTGGTPWFILIDQKGIVVFNDYHLNVDNAIDFLKKVE